MKKILSVIILLLFSISYTTIVFADNDSDDSPFEILLFTNKKEIVVGEPLILTLTIQNKANNKNTFSSVLNIAGDFEVKVFRPYKLPERYLGSSKPAIYPNNVFEEMRPLEKKKITYMVLYDKDSSKGLLFDMPGEYVISVSLKYEAELKKKYQVSFPPLKIQVAAAKGEDEQLVNSITNKDVYLSIQKMNAVDTVKDEMKKLAEKYPKAILTPYIEYALLRTISDASRAEETYPKAIAAFDNFAQTHQDFPFIDYVYFSIANYYNSLQKKEEAAKYLIHIYNHYPESPMISEKSGLFKDILFRNVKKVSEMDWMLYP